MCVCVCMCTIGRQLELWGERGRRERDTYMMFLPKSAVRLVNLFISVHVMGFNNLSKRGASVSLGESLACNSLMLNFHIWWYIRDCKKVKATI